MDRVSEYRVGLDVDQVVADLHSAWLDAYNAYYNDHLSPADIRSWDIEKWVKPECGTNIFSFLGSDLYDKNLVKPVQGSLEVVQQLRKLGVVIYFVSSCFPGTEESKFLWLVRHGFLTHGERHRFIAARDKSDVPVDVLVDDAIHNVETFKGWAILLAQPHNSREISHRMRVKKLRDILPHIETSYQQWLRSVTATA